MFHSSNPSHLNRVPPTWKSDARHCVRLAKRRGFDIAPSQKVLVDLTSMSQWFSRFGKPPSDQLYSMALRAADLHGVDLTVDEAMNEWRCRWFLEQYPLEPEDPVPSDLQIDLGRKTAKLKSVTLPEEAMCSTRSWKAFMRDALDRADLDDVFEIMAELAISAGDTRPDNWGFMVRILEQHRHVLADPEAMRSAKLERARDMLVAGSDPMIVADALRLDDVVIGEVLRDLEGHGQELIY